MGSDCCRVEPVEYNLWISPENERLELDRLEDIEDIQFLNNKELDEIEKRCTATGHFLMNL
jgi:hypothetical protein